MAISKLGNDKLKWETLTDYNFGIDFGFFNNRLSGSVDLYQRLRKDVILEKNLMSYQEVKKIDYNSATVYRARGIDIGIHSVNFDNKNFGWTTDINSPITAITQQNATRTSFLLSTRIMWKDGTTSTDTERMV